MLRKVEKSSSPLRPEHKHSPQQHLTPTVCHKEGTFSLCYRFASLLFPKACVNIFLVFLDLVILGRMLSATLSLVVGPDCSTLSFELHLLFFLSYSGCYTTGSLSVEADLLMDDVTDIFKRKGCIGNSYRSCLWQEWGHCKRRCWVCDNRNNITLWIPTPKLNKVLRKDLRQTRPLETECFIIDSS